MTTLTDEQRKKAAKALVETYLGFPAPDREPCDLDLKAVDAVLAVLSASIADTAGAKPIGEVKYALDMNGGGYFAAVKWLDDTAIEEGALLYLAAPPAPSVADAAGASECTLSDEWIEMYALRHIAPHAKGFKKAFGLDVPYRQTEQFERVKAYTQSVCAAIKKESGND